jgi:hypothetical protein
MSDALRRALEDATRRKCFISYSSGDATAVDRFLSDFSSAFIPKAIGVSDADDFIDSENADYVMARIRQEYLGDSTTTLCLVGPCTHSRRYIDWEIKTTLRRGSYTPNGLVGILLPEMGDSGYLPPRFRDNWNQQDEARSYAIYRSYPSSTQQLRGWIEDAHSRRTTHADRIVNSQDMMKYNRVCRVHGVTH